MVFYAESARCYTNRQSAYVASLFLVTVNIPVQSLSLVQNQFADLCIQFPLTGFQANCEQKALITSPTPALMVPGPYFSSEWCREMGFRHRRSYLCVFVWGRWKEAGLHICSCEDCDSPPFSSSPHSTELMTAASITLWTGEWGDSRGCEWREEITVLNPQMEFCSLSLWNDVPGLLSLQTRSRSSVSKVCPPQNFLFFFLFLNYL